MSSGFVFVVVFNLSADLWSQASLVMCVYHEKEMKPANQKKKCLCLIFLTSKLCLSRKVT